MSTSSIPVRPERPTAQQLKPIKVAYPKVSYRSTMDLNTEWVSLDSSPYEAPLERHVLFNSGINIKQITDWVHCELTFPRLTYEWFAAEEIGTDACAVIIVCSEPPRLTFGSACNVPEPEKVAQDFPSATAASNIKMLRLEVATGSLKLRHGPFFSTGKELLEAIRIVAPGKLASEKEPSPPVTLEPQIEGSGDSKREWPRPEDIFSEADRWWLESFEQAFRLEAEMEENERCRDRERQKIVDEFAVRLEAQMREHGKW